MSYDALEFYVRILGVLAIAVLFLWLVCVAWLIYCEARKAVQRRTEAIEVDTFPGVGSGA
jgi:hypothetical protein